VPKTKQIGDDILTKTWPYGTAPLKRPIEYDWNTQPLSQHVLPRVHRSVFFPFPEPPEPRDSSQPCQRRLVDWASQRGVGGWAPLRIVKHGRSGPKRADVARDGHRRRSTPAWRALHSLPRHAALAELAELIDSQRRWPAPTPSSRRLALRRMGPCAPNLRVRGPAEERSGNAGKNGREPRRGRRRSVTMAEDGPRVSAFSRAPHQMGERVVVVTKL